MISNIVLNMVLYMVLNMVSNMILNMVLNILLNINSSRNTTKQFISFSSILPVCTRLVLDFTLRSLSIRCEYFNLQSN